MQTIHALGRNGWDGIGSPAIVTVDTNWGAVNNGTFVGPGLNPWTPVSSVAIGRLDPNTKDHLLYSVAAAIDVVAHEWGHGVIFTSANFQDEQDGPQLHEGFADVIGYITEFDHQPQGPGDEQADWESGEDSGYTARRVDLDDGPGGYTFHREDDPSNQHAHDRGNMVPVAFRLLDVGGQNPICARTPGTPGTEDCSISVNAQGMIKARSIFFRLLVSYATSTTTWEDLADLGKEAAFSLYCDGVHPFSSCSEQNAVNHAFGAIGYPGAPGCIQCPTW